MIKEFKPYKRDDVLKAHRILTYVTVEDNGKYSNHPEAAARVRRAGVLRRWH